MSTSSLQKSLKSSGTLPKLETFQIQNYVINERRIGKGSFAEVFKGYNTITKKVVAVKRIDMRNVDPKLRPRLDSEIELMRDLKNKYIVRLIDVIYDTANNYVYLIIEYCSGGDLSKAFKKDHKYTESDIRTYFRQIAKGLKYLRSKNIIHRDLKPQNLLLSSRDKDAKVKITDFGFAKILDKYDMAETLCGSPLYMAPEIIARDKYTVKADLWSLGIILYEALFRAHPLKVSNMMELCKAINDIDRVIVPSNNTSVSNGCKNLLESLLIKDVGKRMDWNGFFNHPWIVDKPTPPLPISPKSRSVEIGKHRDSNDTNIISAPNISSSPNDADIFKFDDEIGAFDILGPSESRKLSVDPNNNPNANGLNLSKLMGADYNPKNGSSLYEYNPKSNKIIARSPITPLLNTTPSQSSTMLEAFSPPLHDSSFHSRMLHKSNNNNNNNNDNDTSDFVKGGKSLAIDSSGEIIGSPDSANNTFKSEIMNYMSTSVELLKFSLRSLKSI